MSRLFCICFFGTKIYPIFARMSKNENLSSTYKCNFLGADNKQ